ncbi:putative lactoylglutathione lyase [Aspergillus heteromorphus CBS 117.55]|uniref:Putative lactoylglutathione lyase n=1 Tax=Aspergillus heteromorphus CBS 117.55 TaxID=1448321 RepID=A0A317VIU9_9EURO|nr:putative lactoylglutathione lyase [Aspergillus heteromorphus CBS 117.55]PWY71760.1 putative lactoylglutathione lyase [Aspergillus heteromorphus CBS 117.55]
MTTNNPPGVLLPGATKSYHLNHFMLRTTDPTSTLHFYLDLMGMRTVFTLNAGPFTIYYLGYPATDADRADVARWAERTAHIPTLTRTLGLLEFYYMHGSENVSSGNIPPNLGFGHLGFSVPDVGEAVERLRGEGVRVIKELGEVGRETVPISEWEVSRGIAHEALQGGFLRIWARIACVEDPNGYMVELVPQDMEGMTS